MKTLTDFLTLRPVFTRRTLLAVWYLYLAATVLQIGQYLILLFGTQQVYGPALPVHYYISLIAPLVLPLAYLALVRIFLEMAVHFVEKRSLNV